MKTINKIKLIIQILILTIKIKNRKDNKDIKQFYKKIVYLIEKLGTIAIKLGQILSTRIDILEEDFILELKKLQTNTKSINFKKIKKIIEESTNNKIENIFKKKIGRAHV